MARYIRDLPVSIPAEGALNQMIHPYLISEGYEYMTYKGENVYKKGKGLLCAPSFFKFTMMGTYIRMETWMKFALLPGVYVGEINTTGVMACAVKGPWKQRITYIENMFGLAYSSNPAESIPYQPNPSQYYNQPQAAPMHTYGMNGSQSSPSICPNCGMQVPANSNFCQNCGNRIS